MEKLKGVIPALYTPYDEQGNVSTAILPSFLRFLIDRGCSGLFVGGSTGEGLLQTVEERKDFLEAVVKTVAGEVPVIAHVGALSTRDACELARFSSEVGADAISSVMPFYYPVGIKGAVAYYRALAEAGELPLYVYYLQSAASQDLNPKDFAENFVDVPYLVGMKYTSPDLETFRKIIEYTDGKLNMVSGRDQVFLAALVMGADAAIGTSYNYMPEVFVEVYNAYRAGNIERARKLMVRAFRVIHMLENRYQAGFAARRAIARIRGFDIGLNRGPIPQLEPGDEERLKADLEGLDFFSDPIR